MKITTIGGGNGQSNLLDGFAAHLGEKVFVSSIVSMSDDGRTTGTLMRAFREELDLHLPPPGDLRRCLFSLSNSIYKDYFTLVFEYVFQTETEIKNFTILELINQVHRELLFFGKSGEYKAEFEDFVNNKSGELFEYLGGKFEEKINFKLPLNAKLKGHKFGNILMASLFYNLDKDYDLMLDFMHILLEVKGDVIPVTTEKAFIRAVLGNGEIIDTQDRISNVANYNAGIAGLELMSGSDATYHNKACDAILDSDYIVIGPGDLFTSIISNFIVGGIQKCIKGTSAKIIYIGNNTNKGGETIGLTQLDFLNKVERFLGRRIDIFIANNKKPDLSDAERVAFESDISVKGGDYLFVSPGEKQELVRRKVELIEADLLGKDSFYKHDKEKLLSILESVFFQK